MAALTITRHAMTDDDILIQRALLAPAVRKSWLQQRIDAIRARRATKESQK